MVEGIGPSMDVPCKSLQEKYTTVRKARGKGKWNSIQLVLEDTLADKWNKVNTHNVVMLVQFPIKSGIFPDSSFPSILLQEHMKQMNI